MVTYMTCDREYRACFRGYGVSVYNLLAFAFSRCPAYEQEPRNDQVIKTLSGNDVAIGASCM